MKVFVIMPEGEDPIVAASLESATRAARVHIESTMGECAEPFLAPQYEGTNPRVWDAMAKHGDEVFASGLIIREVDVLE